MKYKQWVDLIFGNKPVLRIVEIGVLNGDFAVRLIKAGQTSSPSARIFYHGIDLFETIPTDMLTEENSLQPQTIDRVRQRILSDCPSAIIDLRAGYSKDVLPGMKEELAGADLIYIDGGHAVATIRDDWQIVSTWAGDETRVVMDDYYDGRDDIGAKRVVEEIDQSQWEVSITDGKTCDSAIGLLVVRQACLSRRARFGPSSAQNAQSVILEPLDGGARDWATETAATGRLLRKFLSSSQRVCDVGCGIGRLAIEICSSVCSVDAVDNSPEMLALLQDELAEREIRNVRGWLTNDWIESTAPGLYDLFLAIFVLQHIKESELLVLLQALKAKSTPGALLLVINTPSRFIPQGRAYWDDGLDVRALLQSEFELLEALPLHELGESVAKHHFGTVYRINNVH
jgi:SAM-dependent methyltransferase